MSLEKARLAARGAWRATVFENQVERAASITGPGEVADLLGEILGLMENDDFDWHTVEIPLLLLRIADLAKAGQVRDLNSVDNPWSFIALMITQGLNDMVKARDGLPQ